MKLIFFLSFSLFITSCQNQNEISYINLEQAFVDWYYKHNPSTATTHHLNINNDLFDQFNLDAINEKTEDIRRFKIELSQIDETKLNKSKMDRFIKLNTILDYLNLNNEIDSKSNYNIINSLSVIYKGLFYILYISDIDMVGRVEALSSRLEGLSYQLSDITSNITCINKYHYDIFSHYNRSLYALLDEIPVNIFSDNITLDRIDEYISSGRQSLSVLENTVNKMFSDNCSIDANINKYAKKIIPESIPADSLNIDLDKSIRRLKNDIFNISLIEYLIENDEPIWVDYDDTLSVINTIVSKMLKSNINSNEIISEIYRMSNSISSTLNESYFDANTSINEITIAYEPILINYDLPISFMIVKLDDKQFPTIYIYDKIKEFSANSSLDIFSNPYILELVIYSEIATSKLIENQFTRDSHLNFIYYNLFLEKPTISFVKNMYINNEVNESNNLIKLAFKIESLVNIYKVMSILNNYNLDETINLFAKDQIISSFINIEGVLREINLNYKGLLKQFFCNETLFLKNISNINKYVDELKNSTIFILDNPQIIYEGSLD